MIARTWRMTGLAALFALAAAVPGPAHASAPVVTCLNAWGRTHPSAWCDTAFTSGTVYPNDNPIGYGEKGVLWVRGTTSPSAFVTVSATDGVLTVSKVVTSAAADDVGNGTVAGDFNADLKITDLGVHTAAPGAKPDSLNPNDRGPSTITVSAVAQDSQTGLVSGPATTTVTKYAAVYRDTFAPSISKTKFPPANWCHSPTTWRVTPFLNVFPFFLFCSQEEGATRASFVGVTDPFFGQGPSFGFFTPFGVAPISGLIDDDGNPSNKSSEIASVKVTVSIAGVVLREFTQLTRVAGPQAKFDFKVNINDFEPNWPEVEFDESFIYHIEVTAADAWGNTSTTSSDFTVYPF